MSFCDEDCETLIELIRQHPPLYNAQLDSYRDENLKDNIWKSIAESINKTGELFLFYLFCIKLICGRKHIRKKRWSGISSNKPCDMLFLPVYCSLL